MFKKALNISSKMTALPQKYIGIALIILGVILFMTIGILKANFDAEAVFLCEAVAENPDLDMSQCPAHNSSTSWTIIVGFIIGGILVVAGIYFFFADRLTDKATKERKMFKKINTTALSKEEEQIYNFIKQHSGSVYQSNIVTETGFSKVKTSRILDKLESMDIIERRRRGMTNIVVLK